MDDSKPIALITGASSGLGEALAYALAKDGYQLILMARRIERLKVIQAAVSTPCEIFQVDLSQSNEVVQVLKKLPTSIDLLICNAGYRIKEAFEVAPHDKVADQITSMILSHNRLIQHYLPIFMQKKHGDIIMVSSIAGLLPSPGPLYGPIKAYQHHQAINLHAQYKRFGIHCLSLCPGLIETEFHTANGLSDWANISSRWWMQADVVAAKTIQQLRKRKTFYIPGWYNRLLYYFAKYLPVRLQQICVSKVF
ncbi:MAG: SDR family NAD(P)-dependent oxidoreductase [Pseudomonadota bacterium]|nr:SDR family NAD(P)-dependent oxidoreductase [Pseudomonadota bacterium]